MTSIPRAERSGWYYGWNIVAVCVLSQIAVIAVPLSALSLFLQPWSAELHVPISKILLIGLGGFGLGYALLSPFIGILSDKYPARLLFSMGLAGIALFSIAMSFVNAAWQILALYAIALPVFISLSAAVTANAVVARWFVRRRGLALGVTAFGRSMGGVVIPPIVAALAPEFGWRAIWRLSGIIIAIVIAPLVIWVLRDRPTAHDGYHYVSETPSTTPHHAVGGASDVDWRAVFSRRNFWILLITYLPMHALHEVGNHTLAPIAASHGLGQQAAGNLIAVFNLSYLSTTLVAGLLSDRFGNRLPLAALAVTTAMGGVVLALGQTAAAVVLGIVLIGTSGGLWPLLAAAAAAEFGANGVGRAFGLLSLFLPVGIFAPSAVSKIQELTSSYAPGLIGLAAISIVGGTVCLFMREKMSSSAGETFAPREETFVPRKDALSNAR